MNARDKVRAAQLRRINAVDFEGEAKRRGYMKMNPAAVYVPRHRLVELVDVLQHAILRYAQHGTDSVRAMGLVMTKLDTQIGCHDVRTGDDSEATQ